jgi:hypothetical protein
MSTPGKTNSIVLTEGPSRAAARAMLRGVGFSKEDLHKPIIGIANTWTEIGPCNYHLRDVAEAVKQGVREAGGTPMEFNTVTISDGITMGTEGMKASLISRDMIADSIELVAWEQLRWAGVHRGLRQEYARCGDGAGTVGYPGTDALWRQYCAGADACCGGWKDAGAGQRQLDRHYDSAGV